MPVVIEAHFVCARCGATSNMRVSGSLCKESLLSCLLPPGWDEVTGGLANKKSVTLCPPCIDAYRKLVEGA